MQFSKSFHTSQARASFDDSTNGSSQGLIFTFLISQFNQFILCVRVSVNALHIELRIFYVLGD